MSWEKPIEYKDTVNPAKAVQFKWHGHQSACVPIKLFHKLGNKLFINTLLLHSVVVSRCLPFRVLTVECHLMISLLYLKFQGAAVA